jgi:hypothetical protein
MPEGELCPRCGAYWRPCECDDVRYTTNGCLPLELDDEQLSPEAQRILQIRSEMLKAIVEVRKTRLIR